MYLPIPIVSIPYTLQQHSHGSHLSQILPNIRLAKAHNARRIQTSRLRRRPRRNSESLQAKTPPSSAGHPTTVPPLRIQRTYQRRIIHRQDHDATMLGTILAPAADMGLDHVAAVEEGHLPVGLDPHLVAGVRRHHVQRRHVQPELARLGELAETGAEREQIGSGDGGGEVGEAKRQVVDARLVQAEDVSVVGGGGVGTGGGGWWGVGDQVR